MYGYDYPGTCDQIHKVNEFDETCQVCVPQAFQCLREGTDFERTIRLAVSIGGDSDTIAAIAGSMAEAAYAIPEWIKQQALAFLPADMKEVIAGFKNTFDYEKPDYSMYLYYKGSEDYPNKKAAFFGFYERSFEFTYQGSAKDKQEAFEDFIRDLLYEQCSDATFGPIEIDKDERYADYYRVYREPDYKIECFEYKE